MELNIRPVTATDAAAITALLNAIIALGTATVMDEPGTEQEQQAFIRDLPERAVYLLAEDPTDGRVLGIQDVLPLSPSAPFRHVGEISTFVALDAQGRGVGPALSRATYEAARAQGYLKLRATIRSDNPRAVAFYLKQGFQPIGTARRHAWIGGRFVDEVLAEKFLDG